jgi:REP element-mobilizing transposase RayT
MYPRRLVLQSGSFAHVFFRCHDRNMFFKDHTVKLFLLLLWAKYRKKYGVDIYEFIIMDNHAHLLIKAESVEGLGHFMRTVNSQLARYINKHFQRDSQAIRERYKSPVITNTHYFKQVRSYIWLNRYRIDKTSDPLKDLFCSASWHVLDNTAKLLGFSGEQLKLFEDFLQPSPDAPPPTSDRSKVHKFFRGLLTAAISVIENLESHILCHGHTIGDKVVVTYRGELFSPSRRERVPWVKSDPPSQLSYGF